MGVLDHDEQRSDASLSFCELAKCVQRRIASTVGRKFGPRGSDFSGDRKGQKVRKVGHRLPIGNGLAANGVRELAEPFGRRIGSVEARHDLELTEHRIKRGVGVQRRSLIRDSLLSAGALHDFGDQPRLADARFAADQHELTFALARLLPAIEQRAEFVVTPDELAEASTVQSVKAAFGDELALEPPRSDRHVESADRHLAKIAKGELVADKPSRGIRNHHLVRAAEALETSGEIGCFAHHRPAFVNAGADKIANDHFASCDPDTGCKTFAGGRTERGHLQEHRSCRAKGSRRIILVRLRPAEIYEKTISERLRNVATKAGNLLGDNSLVFGNDFPHFFRIKPRHQPGRADQVGEHHRYLPPFGGISSGPAWRAGDCQQNLRIEIGDCLEDPLARSQR